MSSGIVKGRDQQADGSQAVAVVGKTPARRGFLLGAGAAAGAAGAAAIALRKSPQVAAQVAEPATKQEPEKGRGYHVTAHIQKYYDTTKV